MKRPHECLARQYGDQMICAACGLNWDTNDPEPPECRKVDKRTKKAKARKGLPHELPDDVAVDMVKARKGLPHELPADVAAEMVKTYQANRGGLAGMQAAYRLFLDRVEL